MKKMLGILTVGLLWCNVSFAGREEAKAVLWNKIKFGLEGAIIGAFLGLLAFVFAKIIKVIFKKNIETENYYSYAIIGGFIAHITILTILKH